MLAPEFDRRLAQLSPKDRSRVIEAIRASDAGWIVFRITACKDVPSLGCAQATIASSTVSIPGSTSSSS